MSQILDGCCGAGGAAHGLAAAGHRVHGVDTNPRLRADYLKSGAASFMRADILEVLRSPLLLHGVSFILVAPPCQFYSQMSRCRPSSPSSTRT